LPAFTRFLGLVRERRVDEFQQRVVLPHAEAECHSHDCDTDDQPRAQLLEMIDRAEPVFVSGCGQRLQP